MKFQYSVIGDNTQENREWLDKVGYKLENQHEDGEYLVTHLRLYNITPLYWCAVPLKQDKHVGSINCIGNYPLFKAVTAVRKDSDYMQWFTDDKEWFLCKRDEFRGYSEFSNPYSEFWGYNYHKATLTELQEHFKLK